MQIKPHIVKYLLLIIGIYIARFLLQVFAPDLFTTTIIGDGFTQTRSSFFGLYQIFFFNILIAVAVYYDLKKMGRNNLVIPILCTLSFVMGLTFFFLSLLQHLISKHERI
ncbi:MAG: hypothetical protein JEZ01_10045 [Labilibaculum sp.]|nr:hypothetical protein [Labilibaculum sp.]MBI9058097.1 hypothetical protein [Labilibaculum sp.]